MNTFDGKVPLDVASPPPGSQDAHVQWKHVPGFVGSGPLTADRIYFAAAVNDFDHHIDPSVPNGLGQQNDPGKPTTRSD